MDRHDLDKTMLFIRRVEERIIEEYPKQQMRCPIHLCIGQEAVATGVCAALKKRDLVFPFYRSHGWYLAKGGNLPAMVAELYGRPEGCSHGCGGSMHLIDREAGVMGASAIVAGMIPQAAGAALAHQLRGDDVVCVVPFGDGAIEEGAFHETMNFAALRRLPLVFVCENNGLAVNTYITDRQPPVSIWQKAEGYGVRGEAVDGIDPLQVYQVAQEAVKRARDGGGPTLIECETNRARVHCGPEEEEQEDWDDPLDWADLTEDDYRAVDAVIAAAFV